MGKDAVFGAQGLKSKVQDFKLFQGLGCLVVSVEGFMNGLRS